jgi:SAM-dependent methyltransferase
MNQLAKDHYDGHLASVYTWIFGDYDSAVANQISMFTKFGLNIPNKTKVAFDLGCGSGFQSVALEKLGYSVHAIDFSQSLLEELTAKSSTIHTYQGDLTDLSFAGDAAPELIVCMGDTVTHLASHEIVLKLLHSSYEKLEPNGSLVLSFRDLSQSRSLNDRFIPVKCDENRILTCFLEDLDPEKVRVFDLLYEKDSNASSWSFKKSFYEKLKISPFLIVQWMRQIGYDVFHETTPSKLEVVIGYKSE